MKKSKHQKIKEHLESGKTITSWEAIQLYNVTRLAAIIFNLKEKGWIIETTNIIEKNNSGETIKYAKYTYFPLETKARANEDKIIKERIRSDREWAKQLKEYKEAQMSMFASNPESFKRRSETPPKLKKGDIR